MITLFDIFPKRISTGSIVIVLLFILTSFLLVFQLQPTMLDPDGFFHAKMGVLTAEQGYVDEFSWLPYTTLLEFWTDQHYLYHFLSIPFVLILDPLWGVKLFTVVLGVLFGITFFNVLRNFLGSSRYAFWWTLLLFSSAGFVLRLTQVKAQPLALIFFLLILLALYRNKYIWFGALTFLYVHTHGSFILVPLIVGWMFLFDVMYTDDRKTIVKKYVSFFVVSIFAIAAGLFSQPTFPDNLTFYYHQIVQIAALRVGALEVTGLEWGALSFFGWLRLLGPLLLPLIFLLVFYFTEKQKLSYTAKYFIWLLLPFIFLTSRSIRHLEFFLPVFIIVLSTTWQSFQVSLRVFFKSFHKDIEKYPIAAVSILALPFVWLVWSLLTIYNFHAVSAPSLYEYSAFSEHISKTVPIDTIIVNTRWDMFPKLFYYTDHSYISGMDPGFLYLADTTFYEQFDHLRDENVTAEDFVSFLSEHDLTYVVTIDTVHDDTKKLRLFKEDSGFSRLYDDKVRTLYLFNKE